MRIRVLFQPSKIFFILCKSWNTISISHQRYKKFETSIIRIFSISFLQDAFNLKKMHLTIKQFRKQNKNLIGKIRSNTM